MKRLFQTCLLALLAVAGFAVETAINVDTSQPKAVLPYLSFDQGAVYDYRVYVKSSGRRAELTGADVCVIQFSSNLTASAWAVFASTSVNTNNGSFLVPSGYFTGPQGDGFYQVYTYSTNNPARKYGLGNGTYRLEQTSGYGAVTPGFYTVPLNTDIVEQTGSNRFARLSEIISASGYVTTNAFYGTTDVLRASVTALSGTVTATNALFAAWFAGLFSETNKWMAAYGWGNWAAPVASNTAAIAALQNDMAALSEFAATNHVRTWTDEADTLSFWVETGSTNRTKYTRTLTGTNFMVTLSEDFLETFGNTRPAWTNHVWPFTDGLWVGSGFAGFGLGPIIISYNAPQAAWTVEPHPDEYPVILTTTGEGFGTATVSIAGYTYATNVARVYILTTGDVWTAIGTAQATADEALMAAGNAQSDINGHAPAGTIAAPHLILGDREKIDASISTATVTAIVYSNAVSQLMIYTNASGAATSWWQVARGTTNSGTFAQGTPGAITNGQASATLKSVIIGGSTYIFDNGSIAMYGDSSIYAPGGLFATYYNGSGVVAAYSFTVGPDGSGNFNVPNGDLLVMRRLFIGPTIGGKQSQILSDGTNMFFVNVNSVTNALTTN